MSTWQHGNERASECAGCAGDFKVLKVGLGLVRCEVASWCGAGRQCVWKWMDGCIFYWRRAVQSGTAVRLEMDGWMHLLLAAGGTERDGGASVICVANGAEREGPGCKIL